MPEWGDSTEWQYWVIDVVKRHEQEQGYDPHPIGMTMQFPVADQTKVNEPLWQPRGVDLTRVRGAGLVPGRIRRSPPSALVRGSAGRATAGRS